MLINLTLGWFCNYFIKNAFYFNEYFSPPFSWQALSCAQSGIGGIARKYLLEKT